MPIWANSRILPFLWWDFSTFFFNFMSQEYQNEKSPILNGQKSPKHWEKSKKWLCYKPEKFTRCLRTPGRALSLEQMLDKVTIGYTIKLKIKLQTGGQWKCWTGQMLSRLKMDFTIDCVWLNVGHKWYHPYLSTKGLSTKGRKGDITNSFNCQTECLFIYFSHN